MVNARIVTQQLGELQSLTGEGCPEAAARLLSNGETISLHDLSARLDRALAALRGTEITVAAASGVQRTPLEIGEQMVNSFFFDKQGGVSTFIIPAGVNDIQAMKAVAEYLDRNKLRKDSEVFPWDTLEKFGRLPQKYPQHCQERDCSVSREITVTGVVKGTKERDRATQESVLNAQSLGFSDPRDQALAVALFACKYNGSLLYSGTRLRGSIPEITLVVSKALGVLVDDKTFDDEGDCFISATGSPLAGGGLKS
jgi:hypothetical protein